MNRWKFLYLWSGVMGSMDALTGLLLVAAPQLVLNLLGIAEPSPDALVFLSWVGVFVAGVGLSYLMVLGDRRRGRTVWLFTSMIRGMVAAFVTWRIVDGSLVPLWAAVALTDLAVAAVQLWMLRNGWWEEARR